MTAHDDEPAVSPSSFLAAAAALRTIDRAVRTAQTPEAAGRTDRIEDVSSEQVLDALLLLRELRTRLAGWETGLIETARDAGASWADLAPPLGVASRQAAERRYLRLRPGAPGSTGEQRVRATRDRRAGNRAVSVWARDNAAELRRLAGQITALPDLPARARTHLMEALAHDDAAGLVAPLTDSHAHLTARHPGLAARVDDLTRHAHHLRRGDPAP